MYDKIKAEQYSNLGGINTKVSPLATGPTQFLDLTNVDFSTPNSLTKRPGTSLYMGTTLSGQVGGLYEFERLNGFSQIIVTANTNAYYLSAGVPSSFKTGLFNNGIFDFQTFVDRLFMGNGQDFFKWDGANVTAYSLPAGDTSGLGVTAAVGGGLSGIFVGAYGYLNDRGYYGPPCAGFTVTLNGVTFGSLLFTGMTTPTGYGITAISLYRSLDGGIQMFGTTNISSGATTFTDSSPLTIRPAEFNLFFTNVPKYLELYNNQLFMAGFSGALSTVYWSDIGEPEAVDPSFFGEFRTNDGDKITGLKYYNGSLVVSKTRSFHRVVGEDPDNFLFQEVSDQYGCLSNRAMVTYENLLLMLDSKGVVQFNGANLTIISNQIEPIFSAMNVEAAKETAWGLHDRLRNQVIFSIPCNGATFNNCIVAYDYLVDAWTKYEGINAVTGAIAKGTLPAKTAFFGGYTGTVSAYGSSVYGDLGQAMTCLIKTRFHWDMGQSVQKQFRRLFMNVDPILGFTSPINVNLYANYSSSVSATRTMYQTAFQSRIDFGISAKSLAAQFTHVSATLPFKVHGYTIESRFQRNV